jgi:hypothetical protein
MYEVVLAVTLMAEGAVYSVTTVCMIGMRLLVPLKVAADPTLPVVLFVPVTAPETA